MGFKELIQEEKKKDYYQSLKTTIDAEYQNYTVYPPKNEIFRALNLTRYENVKVVILGQDPYHEYRQANGLSFSVNKGVKIPPSLENIFIECHNDVGITIPDHGDLSAWAKQGVLLLNNVLTVRAHQAYSHSNLGWEILTENIIRYLNEREQPMVFILWGKYAKEKAKLIDSSRHLILMSSHPSPYSASYGFFGSRPFSKTNEFLIQHHQKPINWQL